MSNEFTQSQILTTSTGKKIKYMGVGRESRSRKKMNWKKYRESKLWDNLSAPNVEEEEDET